MSEGEVTVETEVAEGTENGGAVEEPEPERVFSLPEGGKWHTSGGGVVS